MAESTEPEDLQGAANAITAAEPARVFVSYASPDAAVAAALVEALERRGIACWIAPRDVKAGALYADAIVRAISGAKALVLVLSESAIGSSHVGKEIERASSKKRPIIALRIDNAPLTPALEYFLSESQWIEAQSDNKDPAYARLIDAILEPERVAPGINSSTGSSTGAAPTGHRQGLRNRILLAAVLSVTAIALAALWMNKFRPETHIEARQPTTSTTAVVSDNSIAVLPFTDMSEKKDQEYFSDGLSEELIDLLSKNSALHVPARTSSFYFKGKQTTIADIAKALGVAHVLEGSVRKSGNTLRVTAQLIRTDNGYHMWSETYDRQLDDVFKVQDEIATAVVAALKLKLLAGPTLNDQQTTNSEAYNEYLIGRHLATEGNWAVDRIATENFRKAVTLDPSYAAAWAELALARFNGGGDCASAAACAARTEEAQNSADKAIALRPDLPDGYSARGYVRAWGLWDFRGAADDFQRALALEPENSDVLLRFTSSVLLPNGRLDEGVSATEKVLKVDPLNATAWRRLGTVQFFRGDYRAAREAMRRSLEINPEQSNTAAYLAFTYLMMGDPATALSLSQRATVNVFRLQGAAFAEHELGHAQVAQQSLDEMIQRNAGDAAYQIAQVFSWWGDKDQAFQWLDKAYLQHDGGVTLVKVDPLLKNLRPDPRYKAFLHKLNLPE
jgi:TolB-like protein/thioredoxin-like negative regulator of GroEL